MLIYYYEGLIITCFIQNLIFIFQQEKIQALQLFADQLIGGEHYDSGAITDKRDQVLDR